MVRGVRRASRPASLSRTRSTSAPLVRISVCQLPDELSPQDPAWQRFVQRLESCRPDIALLNEMPFGPWVPRERIFNPVLADATVRAHETALMALAELPSAVIASRPVENNGRL